MLIQSAQYALTVSLFSGLTSIMPRSRAWQSGGMKWGMWNTPLFTFSSSCRRLSWSKGSAPCGQQTAKLTYIETDGSDMQGVFQLFAEQPLS